MSLFAHANNLIVNGGTFVANANLRLDLTDEQREQRGWAILQQNVSLDAFHNSQSRYDAPKCHPNTRVAILRTEFEDHSQFFLWLYGPAGAGKSAIANTIAEISSLSGNLAASFFFSRTAPGRNNESLFISSIAYQLCVSIPAMRKPVSLAVDDDPKIIAKSLQPQMKKLVIQPLNHVSRTLGNTGKSPRLIDGLDECATPNIQKYILDTLALALWPLSREQLCYPLSSIS